MADLIETVATPGKEQNQSLGGEVLLDQALGFLRISKASLPKAQFGYFPDGDVYLKVAKDGIDVTIATDEELIFNSSQNNLKFVLSDTVTLPGYNVSSASGWAHFSQPIPPAALVTHDLGRVPIVFAFILLTGPGGATALPLPSTSHALKGTGLGITSVTYSVSTTTIEFGYETFTNGNVGSYSEPNLSIRYFIFQENSDTSN